MFVHRREGTARNLGAHHWERTGENGGNMPGSTPGSNTVGGTFNDLDRPCWGLSCLPLDRLCSLLRGADLDGQINGHQHLQDSGLVGPAGGPHSEWQGGGQCKQGTSSLGSSQPGPLQAAFSAQPPGSSASPPANHLFGPRSVRIPRPPHGHLFCPLPTSL